MQVSEQVSSAENSPWFLIRKRIKQLSSVGKWALGHLVPAYFYEAIPFPPTFAQCFMEITHASWRYLVGSSPSPVFHAFVHLVSSVFPLSLSPPGEALPILDPVEMPCPRGSFFTKTILPSSRVNGTFLCTTLDMPPAWPSIHHMLPYLSPPLPWEQGSVLFMVHSWYWDHAGTIVGAK